MRLLILSPAFLPAYAHGGVPRSSFGLAKGLTKLGHEVRVISSNRNGSSKLDVRPDRFVEYQGLAVCYCSAWRGSYLYCPAAKQILSEELSKTDCVLHQGTTWTHFGLLAAKEAGRKGQSPYLIWPRGVFSPAALAISPVRKRVHFRLFLKNWYLRAGAIVATGQLEAEHIQSLRLKGRTEIIPNGIDVNNLQAGCSRDELAQRFGKGLHGRVILALGRLCPIKGLDRLIEAFTLVSGKHGQSVLVLAGPDENGYKRKLQKQAQRLGINGRVVFTGRVDGPEKVGLLGVADMLAMPSGSENFGISAAEAAACRTPVVLTRQCGIAPALSEANAGIAVGQNPTDLAEAIDRLLADDDLRRQMGRNGQELIHTKFSWNHAAKRTEELVQELIG